MPWQQASCLRTTDIRESARARLVHLLDLSEKAFIHTSLIKRTYSDRRSSFTPWVRASPEGDGEIEKRASQKVALRMISGMLLEAVNCRPKLRRVLAVGFTELRWKTEVFGQKHFSRLSSSESLVITNNSDRKRK